MSGVTGATSADKNNKGRARGKTDSDSGSARSSNGKTTESDYSDRIERAGHGGDGVGVLRTSPDPTREGLDYLDHEEAELNLDGWIRNYADIEFTLTVHEAVDDDKVPLTDSNGNYYYVVEFLAVADVHGSLHEMSIDADANSTDVMESRDPATSHSVNGDWVTLKEGMTVDGTGYQAETSTWVDHGTYGPETWTPGEGGDYGVMYDGNWGSSDGDQFDIIGFASVKSPTRAYSTWGVVDEWSWYGEAGW